MGITTSVQQVIGWTTREACEQKVFKERGVQSWYGVIRTFPKETGKHGGCIQSAQCDKYGCKVTRGKKVVETKNKGLLEAYNLGALYH